LKPWQEWFNRTVSPIRSAVERPFAHMKTIVGHTRCRYRGLRRNACAFDLLCAAYTTSAAPARFWPPPPDDQGRGLFSA